MGSAGKMGSDPSRETGFNRSNGISLRERGQTPFSPQTPFFFPYPRVLHLCCLLELAEANGIKRLASNLELHKAESAAVVWVFGGIVFCIVDRRPFFHT